MAIPTSNYAPRQWPIIQGLSYSYISEHFGVLRHHPSYWKSSQQRFLWPSWRIWGWQKNVMNSYLGKDLTFVFLRTFAYELSNFSHKHTRATVSQVHVVLCSRWAWRLKKYPFSVTKLIINFSEQSQIGSKIVVTNHMSLSSTHI